MSSGLAAAHCSHACLRKLARAFESDRLGHRVVLAGGRLSFVCIRVVNVKAATVLCVAQRLILGHQRVRLAHRHDASQHGAAFATLDVVVASDGPHLLSTSRVMSERAETLSVSLGSLNIRRFKVPHTSDRVRQRTRFVAINSTVRSIDTSLSHLHEITLGQLVPDGVLWLERIGAPLRFPVLASHISIVNVVVAGSALVSPRAVLGALNVLNVHQVLHRFRGGFS